MATPPASKKTPDIAVLIGGGLALAGAVVWVASWLTPFPQEDLGQPVSDERPAVTAAAPQSEPSAPAAAPAEPARAVTPGSEGKHSAPETLSDKSTAQPTAKPPARPSAESSEPKAQPIQAKRPAPETGGRGADPSLEAVRGRFVGSYVDNTGSTSAVIGLTLVISSAENGVVKGTATLGGRDCNGDYPMQGSYRSGKLDLRATRMGGPAGDCPLTLNLVLDGNRLTGTMNNGSPVQLKK